MPQILLLVIAYFPLLSSNLLLIANNIAKLATSTLPPFFTDQTISYVIIILFLFFCSSLIVSGLNQVYQSVARLIKLFDDLLICDETAENKEYVTETIQFVEEALQVIYSLMLSISQPVSDVSDTLIIFFV